MDSLGISRELPAADETDPEMPAVEGRPSSPGHRTPGRPTLPGRADRRRRTGFEPQRASVAAGGRASNPSVRHSNPNAMASRSRPGTRPPGQTHPPQEAPSRTGLYLGIAGAAVAIIAVIAFVMVRNANRSVDSAAREAAARAAKQLAAQQAAKASEEDTTPVFLSVISDPLEADVTATWKDGGEKKGKAPLGFEVPRNAKVHFEFSKSGYTGYSMDVIADQAQNVQAALKPAPVAVEASAEKQKPRHAKKEEKKAEAAPSKDGLIDLDDALK